MEKIEKNIEKSDKKECCAARRLLWYLVFVGFAVNYMIRINLNIALVSMVTPRPQNNESLTSECLDPKLLQLKSNKTLFLPDPFIQANETEPDEHATSKPEVPQNYKKFDWNEKVQGMILGSFFWGHWITQVPGGLLANKYGTKLVFGLSNFTGVLCCFLLPLAATWGYAYLIALRTIQGILCGFAWPSMHSMTARWIPPNERSSFLSAYLGSSVGAALTYPMCGFIIERCGWEFVFYVCGVMGTLWYVAWWLLVYDSPTQHPRISQDEKEYIISSLGQSVANKQAPVPWRSIITNVSVCMNILVQFGGVWGLFTLMTHSPTYFKFIHGWNIRATGLLSGMPHIFRVTWSIIFSQLGDYLLRTNKMSRTNVRKLATAVCTIGQGLLMLGLSFSGCNATSAIVFLTAAIAIHGAVSTGPLASIVDLSPNYASVILGIINTLVALTGFMTPAIVGQLTFQNQTAKQWQKVFWVAASMCLSTGILYCIFAKSELQPWNSPGKQNGPEAELMLAKTNDGKDEKNNSKLQLTFTEELNKKV